MSTSFHRDERLRSKKVMDELFKKGKHINSTPLKAVFLRNGTGERPVQAMFVVPKRIFSRANKRNILKRRMREAYRLQKQAFYDALKDSDKKLSLAFIYTSNKECDYTQIFEAINKILGKIS